MTSVPVLQTAGLAIAGVRVMRVMRVCIAMAMLGFVFAACVVTAASPVPAAAVPVAAAERKAWTVSAALTVREGYDSNVFMQRVTPRANRGSAVTTAGTAINVGWAPSARFALTSSYAPEISVFARAASEDHVAHKAALTLAGRVGDAAWELGTTGLIVDGESVGPVFSGPGGAAIVGGVPLMERRDQAMLRQNFKVQIPLGRWFVRPVGTVYVHDFQTELRTTPGYQNYIDRDEFTGGVDVGRRLSEAVTVLAGFRYGAQDQAVSPVSPFHYENRLRRFVGGIEGTPWRGVKLAVLAGADERSFGDAVPVAFERGKTRFFLDASATIAAGKRDTATLAAKRFALPGYGGGSFLEITAYDLTWKRTLSPMLSATIAGRAHHWDFAAPVVRNEWWRGASASLAAKLNARFTLNAAIAIDSVHSKVPNTAGREASRRQATLAASYAW